MEEQFDPNRSMQATNGNNTYCQPSGVLRSKQASSSLSQLHNDNSSMSQPQDVKSPTRVFQQSQQSDPMSEAEKVETMTRTSHSSSSTQNGDQSSIQARRRNRQKTYDFEIEHEHLPTPVSGDDAAQNVENHSHVWNDWICKTGMFTTFEFTFDCCVYPLNNDHQMHTQHLDGKVIHQSRDYDWLTI